MPLVTLSEFLFISQKDVGPILIRFWDYSNPKVHCILTFVPITNGPCLSLAQNLVSIHFSSVTSSFQCLISKAVKLSNFGQKNNNKEFKCSRLLEGDGIEFRLLFYYLLFYQKILKYGWSETNSRNQFLSYNLWIFVLFANTCDIL